MAYESIKVDIIPGAENAEVLHFSQYDNKRPFFIELFNGGAEFIPEEGMTLTLECRKRDGNIVILSDPVLTDNVAEFSTTEQLTACYGDNVAEIKIVDSDDLVIGSANFIINVEKSPTCGGITSQSEIDNLTQQIAAIVPEVLGDDYYNKTETDALLANKANMSDLADLASKEELENAISEEDTSLKNWAFTQFATPGYIANRYYNKNQVDELLFNMLPIDTASGNPCNFDTEIAGVLQDLTAEIIASGGNGTPSNPIPIVGHSELNLDVNGQTFTVAFGQTVYGGVYDKSGRLTITWAGVDIGSLAWQVIEYQGISYKVSNSLTSTIKAPTASSETANIKCSIFKNVSRDELDNFNYVICIDPNKNIDIIDNDYSTAADFTTAMSGVMLAYELATPIVIDVQAISPSAVVGTNNIISDCNGDVNVSYKDSIQHYIDSRT